MEETGKPQIKSTNFIWFASKRECPSALSVCFVAVNKNKSNVNCEHPSLETWWCLCGANAICISEELQRIKKRVERLSVLNLSH